MVLGAGLLLTSSWPGFLAWHRTLGRLKGILVLSGLVPSGLVIAFGTHAGETTRSAWTSEELEQSAGESPYDAWGAMGTVAGAESL